MLNLPQIPFEFVLFAMLLCYAAGMVSSYIIFLFAWRTKKPKQELPWWSLDD